MTRQMNVPARALKESDQRTLQATARKVVPPAPKLGRRQRELIARMRGSLLERHESKQ